VKIKTKPNRPGPAPKLSASKRSSGLPHPINIRHPTSNIRLLALRRPSIRRPQPKNNDEFMTKSRQLLAASPVVRLQGGAGRAGGAGGAGDSSAANGTQRCLFSLCLDKLHPCLIHLPKD